MNEGIRLQQPIPPSGPFAWWKKVAVGALWISAFVGIFLFMQHYAQQGSVETNGSKENVQGVAILPGGIRVPACSTRYEAKTVTTPSGRYLCEFTPDGGHVWRPLTAPGSLAPGNAISKNAEGQQTSSSAAHQPGQSVEQARRDAIAEQRQQKLIEAAFSDSRVSKQQQQDSLSNPPSGQSVAPAVASPVQQSAAEPQVANPPSSAAQAANSSLDFDRNQPLYWLPEGTMFDAVLANKLDGSSSGPFGAIVSIDKYYPGTRILLVPQGAQLLGEVRSVSAFGQERLAVTFHRILIYPSLASGTVQPYSIPLERQPPGQSQDGSNGLTGKVNTHWLSTFGSAAAVGGITGLSELGSYSGGYSPMTGFYMGLSSSASQATQLVLSKYLNRMPTITVPAGTRIKMMLISDEQFPAVQATAVAER